MRAASLGATPLLQAGRQGEAVGHSAPREGGVGDAGWRRASLPPQSKTLSRGLSAQTSKTGDTCPLLSAIHAWNLIC